MHEMKREFCGIAILSGLLMRNPFYSVKSAYRINSWEDNVHFARDYFLFPIRERRYASIKPSSSPLSTAVVFPVSYSVR